MFASRVVTDADDFLAEILAAQEADQLPRCVLKTVSDILLVVDAPFFKPGNHVALELRELGLIIPDNEAAEREALDEDLVHEQRQAIGTGRRSVCVVMGNESANRNAGKIVEQRQHGLEHRATDIFKVNVDSTWAGL